MALTLRLTEEFLDVLPCADDKSSQLRDIRKALRISAEIGEDP